MLGKTPPMGFNTWNTFSESFNDELIKEIADAMVERGFKDAGYEYVVIDDHWEMDERDPETGMILPRPAKFKNQDIKSLVDYVHGKGLKMGIYTCAGVRTCGQRAASYNHEFFDAKVFADWGIDYVKHDYCQKPETQDGRVLMRRMGLALRESGRDILYAACSWGQNDVWSWIRSTGAHMYRSTADIFDSFGMISKIYNSQIDKLGTSAPYCYNDIDMLTVGMCGKGAAGAGSGCTEGEYRIQFCIWCMYSAPLILGCDVRKVSEEYRDLLCNKTLIRINQDPEARPPFPIGGIDRTIYLKQLVNDEYALLFVNTGDNESKQSFISYDMGWTENSGYKIQLTDVFTGEVSYHGNVVSAKVPAHDCRMFIMKLVK